jgi:hypothetical protein
VLLFFWSLSGHETYITVYNFIYILGSEKWFNLDTAIIVLFRFSYYIYAHMKERKKYGLKGARRAPQFSKR